MSAEQIAKASPSPVETLLRAAHYCGMDDRRVVHAVDQREVLAKRAMPQGPHEAVCGATTWAMWQVEEDRSRAYHRGWPCRVVGVRARCSVCHDLTGRKRPHKDWPA